MRTCSWWRLRRRLVRLSTATCSSSSECSTRLRVSWLTSSREPPERTGLNRPSSLKAWLTYCNTERDIARRRSEEHTSELQSRPHLVCRLLLEKKNPSTPRH